MRYAQVLVDRSASSLDRAFTYSVPEGMRVLPGQQVVVPLGASRAEGYVLSLAEETDVPKDKLKPVLRIVREEPVLLPEMLSLAHWMREKYHVGLVDAVRLMLPPEMRKERVREKEKRFCRLLLSEEALEAFLKTNARAKKQVETVLLLKDGPMETAKLDSSILRALEKKGAVEIYFEKERRTPFLFQERAHADEHSLTRDQARAVEEIASALENGGERFLLHGVTGSGKTEVYIRAVRKALEMGKSAIVLVPEIALTPQMVSWFYARFGADAAILHSGLSAGERFDEWTRIRTGEARVVVGVRSAVFAPVQNLGIIVVDEEHESSYLSDRRPRYDAREVAWKRMEGAKGVLVLGSATPSVSTFMRAMPGVRRENRLLLLELPERVTGRPLPAIEVVDMRREFERGNRQVLSAQLVTALKDCLKQGRQAILFINRRGYSSFVSCRKCGYVVKCPSCDVSMTYHQGENRLMCHYCGAETPLPKACPECGSPYIRHFGVGTEKVVEAVKEVLPNARCLRMDYDTTRKKDAHAKILDAFRRHEADILVGTQMIAKGLDFPNVTLVGVVAADMSLNLPDFRSRERTFQLITQVAGRAGRANFPGRVILQTYDPENFCIRLAAGQDFRAFYNAESKLRRESLYPPFTVIARIVVSASEAEAAQKTAEEMEDALNFFLDENGHRPDIVQMRALEAPVKRLRGEYRYQVFLKMYFKADQNAILEEMQRLADTAGEGVLAELEINPTSLF